MNTPLVSVVITSYRRDAKIVEEAIQSVVNQTYRPIEIILVDDNGEDSCYSISLKELCTKYPEVKLIHNKENSGAQISRNNGIKAANGSFIALLDDDDIWAAEKIEKQLKLFTSRDVGMVFCDGYSFYDDDLTKLSTFREASIYNRPISHNMELFNDFIGSTSQAVVRRECFEDIGLFDIDMPARQDYEMWLRITTKYKVVGSPEKLLFYRAHNGDRISTNWDKCLLSYKLILKKYKKDYNKNKYAKAKLIMYMSKFARKKKSIIHALGYDLYAFVSSPRCVVDMVRRKVEKKGFVEFYYDRIKL